MQCEIRGTRKKASSLYRLRPRSPKFRKKGSGNNKTRGTSCVPFHARKKTDLRKKGVNDGPAKGDTFRFGNIRESLSFSLSLPLFSRIASRFSCFCQENREDPESRVACRGTRRLQLRHASRRCAYVTTNILAH